MKPFWIKERHNPQSGRYFVACGQMSKSAAKRAEKALYGDNFIRAFETEAAYSARLDELRKSGERVL